MIMSVNDQDTRKKTGIGRRGFFGAVAGAGAAAAMSVGGAVPVAAQQSTDERKRARYQETEHVQAFYRTNRYYTGD
jgi:nitrous oxide reductase